MCPASLEGVDKDLIGVDCSIVDAHLEVCVRGRSLGVPRVADPADELARPDGHPHFHARSDGESPRGVTVVRARVVVVEMDVMTGPSISMIDGDVPAGEPVGVGVDHRAVGDGVDLGHLRGE
jgi:hypothetical protein